MATDLDCAACCKEVYDGFDFGGIDIDHLLSSCGPERSPAATCPSPPTEPLGPIEQQQSLLGANPWLPAALDTLPWQAPASTPVMQPLPSVPAQPLPQLPPAALGHQLPPQQHPAVLQQQQQQEQQQQQQAQLPEQELHGLPLAVSLQARAPAEEGLLERYWRLKNVQLQGGEAVVVAAQPQHHLVSAAPLTPCPPSPHDLSQLPQSSDAASLQHSIETTVVASQQQQQQPGSSLGTRPLSAPPFPPPAVHPQQAAGGPCASGTGERRFQPLKRSWSQLASFQPVEEQSVSAGQLGDWARLVAANLEPAAQPGLPKPSTGGSAALQAAAPSGSDWLMGTAAVPASGHSCKEAAATIDQLSQAKLSKDEQKQLRKREQARASRARKRAYINSLEQQNEELRQEASRLRRILYAWATQGFVTPEQAQQFLKEKIKARQLPGAAEESQLT